jgi:rhodanese-related sulfurtransferase|tara:strand:- start:161 stop:529 length:369 start_codon:yes stop_codon:yes gene_type:complete
MRIFSSFILICLLFVNCTKETKVASISTEELKELLTNKKIELLDVRTPEETALGFIESAKFANFFDDDFTEQALQKVDSTKTIYLYCRTGNRSTKAAVVLQEKGIDVINISGGYKQWNKENN